MGSVCLSDLSVTLLCDSDDGHTPVNSDQDVDLHPGCPELSVVVYHHVIHICSVHV